MPKNVAQYIIRHCKRAVVNQCNSPDFLICILQRIVTQTLYSSHKLTIILNYGHTRIRYCGVSTFFIGKETEILFCKTEIFFSLALRSNAGHGPLILDVSRSHTTTQHSR